MSYMIGRYIETLSDWGMGAHTCHALRDVFENAPSAVREAAYDWVAAVYAATVLSGDGALTVLGNVPANVAAALKTRTGTDDLTR